MKKLFLVLIISFTLVGCTNADYKESLKQGLEKTAYKVYERKNNHNKKYYSFYLDKSVSSIKSEDSYSVLRYLDNTFTMNLNVREIVSDEYYDAGVFNYDDKYLTFNETGNYVDDFGNESPYHVLVYEVDDSCYLIFKGKDMFFYSLLNKTQVYDMALKMMSILKSVSIEKESVIKDYSSNDVITYTKEATELFTSNVTTTTTLEEIINRNGVYNYEDDQNQENVMEDEQIDDEQFEE